jgi:polyribonucleotide nucleotidyltransferase
MATVCGGSLALMDAGVPISASVAGISVGLVTEYDESGKLSRYLLLDDIIGSEDHHGDMDFKLCGTRKGVTGFQLDLKLPGIPVTLLQEAVHRACASRMKILTYMDSILSQPKNTLSPHAPRIETIKIDPEKIGLLIGPGGKTIKGITAETGADISVEDDGTVRIYSSNGASLAQALTIIEDLCGEVVVGKIYRGKVTGIKEFGAFVEVKSGRDGLVHISELSDSRVDRVEDILKVGDETWVKCIGFDDRGKIKLSRKAALKEISQQKKN